MAAYFIFKTDRLTGKTIHICNGVHNDERECRVHWRAYVYGFYDGVQECMKPGTYEFMDGPKGELSFHFSVAGKLNVKYFMLLDKAGEDLIMEICK